jgi:hypothetical protein
MNDGRAPPVFSFPAGIHQEETDALQAVKFNPYPVIHHSSFTIPESLSGRGFSRRSRPVSKERSAILYPQNLEMKKNCYIFGN